jgi:hypothetical protein
LMARRIVDRFMPVMAAAWARVSMVARVLCVRGIERRVRLDG